MDKKFKTLLTLFLSTFYLSAFTFGGGYVIVALMKKRFVVDLKWLEEEEMLNLVAIGNSAPGAVAINASILVGYKVAGFLGAVVAVIGTTLPPLLIISIIYVFYEKFKTNLVVSNVLKGMQAGVAALISDTVFSLGSAVVKKKEIVPILIMVIAFLANYILHINIMLIILASGLIGFIYSKFQAKDDNKPQLKQGGNE